MTNSIVVHNTEISQDDAGRFCLNDLHKAAGGESRHQPGKWYETQNTKGLIEVLQSEITGIPVILSKQGLGTFVVKELVYAYAMWVSPKFHLEVIRTFDAVRSGQMVPMLPEQQAALAMAAWDQLGAIFGAPKHITLQEGAKATMARYGVDLMPLMLTSPHNDAVQDEEVYLEPTELGKLFDLGPVAMNRQLSEMGLQTKVAGEWRPTDTGKSLCIRHAWTTSFKTGYNLKWAAAKIEAMMYEAVR